MDRFEKFQSITTKIKDTADGQARINSFLKEYKPTIIANETKKNPEYTSVKESVTKEITSIDENTAIEKLIEKVTYLTIENIQLKEKLSKINLKNTDN
jgi:hypothetical protein